MNLCCIDELCLLWLSVFRRGVGFDNGYRKYFLGLVDDLKSTLALGPLLKRALISDCSVSLWFRD